jgi:hypothetical protein
VHVFVSAIVTSTFFLATPFPALIVIIAPTAAVATSAHS